jgi:NAD(P)-dependent dehydrogenase (short-subunit alcohol dehydrogenase family)
MTVNNKRIIVISGTTSGIGYDTAYALANASPDNHVVMTARSSAKGVKALEELQARKPQGSLSFLELDISKDESIASFVEKFTAEFDVLDVLVNNAAIATGVKPGEPHNRQMLREAFDTNVFGHLLLTEALEPVLKKSKDPRIINVSSGMGSLAWRQDHTHRTASMGGDLYRTTKTALNMITGNQNYNYRSWGGKAWAYCPGFVVTNLTGEDDRQNRINKGAESSETSAEGILDIVNGKRDDEWNKFVTRRGETYPW